MEGIAVKPLTVDFHEGGFLGKVNGENRLAFWFQLNKEGRKQAGSPWGPANTQALNRYSYVHNNPLKYTDPSGHSVYMSQAEAIRFAEVDVTNLINALSDNKIIASIVAIVVSGGGIAAVAAYLQGVGIGTVLAGLAAGGLVAGILAGVIGVATDWIINNIITDLETYRDKIRAVAGISPGGVIISWTCSGLTCDTTIISRDTGDGFTFGMSGMAASMLVDTGNFVSRGGTGSSVWETGRACTITGDNPSGKGFYKRDTRWCK